jgi:hypothetical protein
MAIRLQTSRGTDILNEQLSEISAFERNWAAPLRAPQRTIRTGVDGRYNCHGLTFACRRTRIPEPSTVSLILAEDEYAEVSKAETLPGDIVVYYSDEADPTHSGVVVENVAPLFVPWIVSKWGSGPEVIHRYWDVPQVYGTNHRFYRCRGAA